MSVEDAYLKQDLIHRIRSFFLQKKVLEVDTPLLSNYSGVDPHIDIFKTEFEIDGQQSDSRTLYLASSPEFHMKRLLASGYPSIYQITRGMRNGEVGRNHNPEFLILEWYRLQFDLNQLVDEVLELVHSLGAKPGSSVYSYYDLFMEFTGINPFDFKLEIAIEFSKKAGLPLLESTDCNDWLSYLMSSYIEKKLGWDMPVVLMDYPADQAALAQTYQDERGNEVAKRFELYIEGTELCNGYQELLDPEEQQQRFTLDF